MACANRRRDEQTFSFCFEGERFRELAGVAGKTCWVLCLTSSSGANQFAAVLSGSARPHLAFDNEVGVGKSGFQFEQNTSCAQFNELFSLLQPLHSIGPQWFEPCEQRAV